MAKDWKESLYKLKRDLATKSLASKDYQGTIDAIGTPSSRDDSEIVAFCHYQLAKIEATSGRFGQAHLHATQVEQINPSSRSIRALNSERLKLMSSIKIPNVIPQAFDPGEVNVPGCGEVLVLGRYETWGHHGELTKSILILKKAPQEFVDESLDIRGKLIEGLGSHMLRLLQKSSYASEIDLLIPIPPSPERYSIRMFHTPTEIAKIISQSAAIPLVTNLLLKVRDTQSLRDLGRYERAEEIAGSMAVSQKKQFLLDGMTALLIDDVVTWGTHFREARRILLEGGAHEVRAMALANAHSSAY